MHERRPHEPLEEPIQEQQLEGESEPTELETLPTPVGDSVTGGKGV